MPSTFRPASLVALIRRSISSRRDGDDDDARARAAGGLDLPERDVVEDRLVHRHRDVVRRLGAHGGVERLGVLERRQVERAHDDALVGDAQADAVRKVVLGEEGLERLGERRRVGDLTVAQDARAQLGDGAALDGDVAVHLDLGGRDVAGVEIEPDHRLVLVSIPLEHDARIGTRGALSPLNRSRRARRPASKRRAKCAADYQLLAGRAAALGVRCGCRNASRCRSSALAIVNVLPVFEVDAQRVAVGAGRTGDRGAGARAPARPRCRARSVSLGRRRRSGCPCSTSPWRSEPHGRPTWPRCPAHGSAGRGRREERSRQGCR